MKIGYILITTHCIEVPRHVNKISKRRANMSKTKLSILGIAVIALLASGAWAQGMGGWGMGMMDDSDMPMMGSGMGMMGGGMGPGSCGMMGGGMGMMGYGAFGTLDLTKDQQAKISKIQDELRKQHWALMGKMIDEQAKLRDLYSEDKLDAKKIGAVSDSVYALRKQMMESRIDATNRMRDVLTKEQREQLNKSPRIGSGTMGQGHRHGTMMGQ
jgi:Spy/CpxP family protein refolding chaperone